MLGDREYLRPRSRAFRWSATTVLLALNVVAFILQSTILPRLLNPDYLMLSVEGLSRGFVWQLLTYQFLHGGVFHLLLNCWALFMFGREVEANFGQVRFVALYLVSGVAGGLLQAMASYLWPHYFGGPVVGASAGVFGVVAAFAMLYPDRRLVMLLFMILPVTMRAKSLLWFSLILTTVGIAFPNSTIARTLLGGNVAHAAHLGGILTGLMFRGRRSF
jgi:membrane associated rhomboid family serine protease